MKLRADLAAMIVAGLSVVAITALALYGRPIPEVLTTVALIVVGGGIGIAAPALGSSASPAADTTTADAVAGLAGRLEDLLAHAETSTGAARAAAQAAIRAANAVTDSAPAPAVPTPYTPPATSYSAATTTGSAS